MRSRNISIALSAVGIVALTICGTSTRAAAQQEKVLHSFYNNGRDGVNPTSGLISDAAGNLYGTAPQGGPYGQGIAFELIPKAGGVWTETVLHAFGNAKDGGFPGCRLIFDAAGNLYGTTGAGGLYGTGAVFELSPQAGGTWKEKILYSFNPNRKDGSGPGAGLIFDSTGNLYGTTGAGGRYGNAYNGGIVFELSPQGNGSWTESILHNFNPNSTDGSVPAGGVIFDPVGNLYGTTGQGGAYMCGSYGCGTVFELTPTVGKEWVEKILHNFQNDGTDGYQPSAGLVIDRAGNLYGVTAQGGAYAIPNEGGIVFKLGQAVAGHWNEAILHNFAPNGTDGTGPSSGLTFDAVGNLYGTTIQGGSGFLTSLGTLYEMTPVGGSWTERILHSFPGDAGDGAEPMGGVIADDAGNLYGTTFGGGAHPYSGTVYKVTP